MVATYWDTTTSKYQYITYGNSTYYEYQNIVRKAGYDFDYIYKKYYMSFNKAFNSEEKRKSKLKVV